MRAAKKRMKAYTERDQNKIKTDVARNDFESMIYRFREWLREEDNEKYVVETEREKEIE